MLAELAEDVVLVPIAASAKSLGKEIAGLGVPSKLLATVSAIFRSEGGSHLYLLKICPLEPRNVGRDDLDRSVHESLVNTLESLGCPRVSSTAAGLSSQAVRRYRGSRCRARAARAGLERRRRELR